MRREEKFKSSGEGSVVFNYLVRFPSFCGRGEGRSGNARERGPQGVVVQSLAVSHRGVVAWPEEPKQLPFLIPVPCCREGQGWQGWLACLSVRAHGTWLQFRTSPLGREHRRQVPKGEACPYCSTSNKVPRARRCSALFCLLSFGGE